MFDLSSISSLPFLDAPRLQVGSLGSRRLEVMGVEKKGAREKDTRPCTTCVQLYCTANDPQNGPQMIPFVDL